LSEPNATPGPTPSPAVAGLTAYRVPKHGAPVDLVLSGNEGIAPPRALLTELAEADPELLRRYPSAAPLEAALAERFGVHPAQVIVTAGGDDALERTFRAFLAPDRSVILPAPTFVMLPKYATLVGATQVPVPWPGGAFPTDAVLAEISEDTGAICVVSPNNPTGAVATADDLRRLSRAAPQAVLVVDLAYGEMADEDLTPAALELPNALVFRTFSKAWGLAGARLGYAIGPAELIAWLRAAGNPYAVSGPSVALGLLRLRAGDDDVRAYVAEVRAERAALTELLREAGAEVPDSQANFVLARFSDHALAQWLHDAAAGLGIAVRLFGEEPPELRGCVRITCPGDAAGLRRVLHAIRAALQPGALVVEGDADHRALEVVAGQPAWYFTKTADGVRAARRAGAVPLGLEGDDAEAPEALIAAGAARVVSGPDALEGLLPAAIRGGV